MGREEESKARGNPETSGRLPSTPEHQGHLSPSLISPSAAGSRAAGLADACHESRSRP